MIKQSVEKTFPPTTKRIHMPPEITDIIIFLRLCLYNQGKPCSAKAIRHEMNSAGITPMPSIASIHRILARQNLTHRRTGFYPGEHENYL